MRLSSITTTPRRRRRPPERIKALGEKVPAPIKSPAKPLFRLLISESSGEETTSPKNAGSEPKPDPRVQQYP